jgi:hypothetical protein
VEIKGKGKKPPVNAEIYMLENIERLQPLVQVSAVSENRPLYTHKAAAPVEGKIVVGDKEIRLHPEKDVGLMDIQKTFYPYRTFWNWATFAGYDERGRLIAMNACKNFIEDDEGNNENCTWVDGEITLLGAATFDFDKAALMKPWKLNTSGYGMDLTFSPQGERVGRVNLGVVMSDFHQPFGKFKGVLPGPDGTRLEIEDLFGLCEWHLARF